MNHSFLTGVLLSVMLVAPYAAWSQERALTVTVTPPLFQLAIGPGEEWSSALKVVNSNNYPVTYYAQIMDFVAEGELGKGELMPVTEDVDPTFSLGSWMVLKQESVTVPANSSGDVPFTVRVPANAEPGGHYAAILVGTQPDLSGMSGPRVAVSSFVTSLVFVRIHGDVDERARIREFYTNASLYQTQIADFTLRFENVGNVHVRPRGQISIYNMWGEERGRVEFNQKSTFGNVLPRTTRRYSFSWEGAASIFDIGRYSAVATLSFGEDLKQNVSATTYFWVIPVIPVSITLGSVLFFVLSLTWFVRRYVRRALMLERALHGESAVTSVGTLMRPLSEGVSDVRQTLHFSEDGSAQEKLSFGQFLRKYLLFFVFLALFVAGTAMLVMYLANIAMHDSDFSVSDVSSEVEQ